MEIKLKPEHEQLIEKEIARGNFSSREEVVAEAIELLVGLREAGLENLRAAVQEGFDAVDRGEYTELKTSEDYRAFAAEISRRASARNAAVSGD